MIENKTIAITGAGSGFGAALARKYAANGWSVAATDIDESSAKRTLAALESKDCNHFALELDVTRDDHWLRLLETVHEHWDGLGILVNNAGVAAAGNFEDTPMADWAWVMDIDLMGVVRGCHHFAGLFKQQESGHFVNVASFAGFAAIPDAAAYCVAKAGVVALSETLRAEMHPHGVGVTVVCPAFVKTGLLSTFRTTDPSHRDRIARWMENSGITAEQIADAIAEAVDSREFLLLTHPKTRLVWRLKRWMPERYFRMLVKQSDRLRASGDPPLG